MQYTLDVPTTPCVVQVCARPGIVCLLYTLLIQSSQCR